MSEVIDFRVQPPHASFTTTHFFRPRDADPDPVTITPFILGRREMPSFDQRSMTVFVQEMEEAGVGHAVVMGQQAAPEWGSADNSDIADLVRSDPQRFTGFAGIDPAGPGAMAEFEEAVAAGCRGVSLLPGWSRTPHHEDDPLLDPLLGACAARGLPVVFTSSHYVGADHTWADPQYLQRAAQRHPTLTVVVGHGCWPWTTAACALAMRCPNVYLMPEFYWYLPGMPGARDYVDAANGYLAHRVLYSSCYPSRPLGQSVEDVAALPLTPATRRLVMRENAARVLGW